MTARVLCFGEVLLRLSPVASDATEPTPFFATPADTAEPCTAQPAATFDAWWGGSEANVAVGLVQLNQPATLLTTLPRSELGQAAAEALRGRGVAILDPRSGAASTSSSEPQPEHGFDEQLGLYFAATRSEGKTVVYQRAHSTFTQQPPRPEQVPWSNFDAFHTSGINPALSPDSLHTTRELIMTARSKGLFTSFDLNLRQQLWSDQDAGIAIRPMLENVDLLIANVHQLASAFNLGPIEMSATDDAEQKLKRFLSLCGANAVVATNRAHRSTTTGKEACLEALFVDRERSTLLATPWFEATDRIGSGDSFTAGLLAHRESAIDRRRPLEAALAAASLANQSPGDFPTFDAAQVDQRRRKFFGA